MKVPEPRRLKSGTWFIQLRLGGVSVPVSAPTARECKRVATMIKADHVSGRRPVTAHTADITLSEVIDKYIASREAVLSPSTIAGYTAMKRQRFTAYMDKPAGKIDYQRMINDELQTVSAKTVKNAWGLVEPSLKAAKIPVPDISLASVPVREIPFLQPDEIKPFCEAVKGDKAEIGILLELQGLRRSEALGLTWDDIDLKRGIIHVRSALVQNKTGEFVKKDVLKNKSSVRDMPIMIPQLRDALAAVKVKQGPVTAWAGNTMNRHIKRACEQAGVTLVTNHGLRHSFASLCYHLGLSERQLMDLGGWSDYNTMHRVYIRLAAADRAAAANAVSDFFSH